jgi:hypothetical protein
VGCVVSHSDYFVSPSIGALAECPHYLHIYPTSRIDGIKKIIKVVYFAGYKMDEVPADLKNACYELAAWNYARNKKVISDDEGMPVNVREMLEPFKRKTI